MNAVKCAVEGCLEEFRTEEAVSSSARFICKNHPRAIQVRAAGRVFDLEKDTQDANVHFQDGQFDRQFGAKSVIAFCDNKNISDNMADYSKRHIRPDRGTVSNEERS